MLVVPLVVAPLLMVCASLAERRFGSAVAGCVGAAPLMIAAAIVTIAIDLGSRAAAATALSAGAHVPAQAAFAVAFAFALGRRHERVGLLVATVAFAAASLPLSQLAGPLALVIAVPAVAAGGFVIGRLTEEPRRTDRAEPSDTVLRALLATLAVGVVVMTAERAGPTAAGTIAAFPAMSALLTQLTLRRYGPVEAGRALRGLLWGLRGYLAFCAAIATFTPLFGFAVALGLALALCATTYHLTFVALRSHRTVVAAP